MTASRSSPARALHPVEPEAVLSRLHEERFQYRSPAAVYATLLDQGEYHCSIRTMYRLLEQHGESRERRDQPPYQKPELMATAPNQLFVLVEELFDLIRLPPTSRSLYPRFAPTIAFSPPVPLCFSVVRASSGYRTGKKRQRSWAGDPSSPSSQIETVFRRAKWVRPDLAGLRS
jgi:hypothetical protein